MDILESFSTALGSLLTNKLRAILTMLGIIIGVAAVIALLSIGNGVSAAIQGQIQGIGSNLITIMNDQEKSGGYLSLSLGDADLLSTQLADVQAVAAEARGTQQVIRGGYNMRVTVSGVTANYFAIRNMAAAQGDLLTDADLAAQSRVAVLGAAAADRLFPDGEFAVGQAIKIKGVSYTVVGVLAGKGGMGVLNQDEQIFVPLTTAKSRLYTARTRAGDPAVHVIYAQATDEERMNAATAQIQDALREQHGIAYQEDDDFTVLSQTDVLDAFGVITSAITLFLGAIAGISLLVGGIGIMNIMLVSVTERTREIGIRKAVGALKRDILTQFLIESLVMSLTGGLIGIALGATASVLIGRLSPDLTPVIDIGTVMLSFGFAAGVGLFFGIYPAWRAASLRPIQALRYE